MRQVVRLLIRKCRSAVWHANNQVALAQSRREWKQKLRKADLWIKGLAKSPPEVLVGANFVDLGGTRMHMHSIQKYSSLRIGLAPDESVMQSISPAEFTQNFNTQFQGVDTSRFRAVHSHVFPFFIDWCRQARKRHNTRWIHTHHNWYYPEFGRNGIEPWQEQFNQSFLIAAAEADVCLCVSRGQQRFLNQQFGLRTHYLPNGVDVAACRLGNAERWRQSTGIRPGFVLFVGRNDPVKDPEFFVRLAARCPERRFVIAGQGISVDVIEREWKLPISENLHVLGQLKHADVQDAIAACDVLVLCSRREGLPTLVLEGLVHGKPVVVPTEQGCLEAVNDGECGFIYEIGNLDDCCQVLDRALGDKTISAHGQKYACDHYAWPEILRKLDGIYSGQTPDT